MAETATASAAPKRRGRPSKRTPELEQLLIQVLGTGISRRAACGYVGISEDSLAAWCRASSDFSDRLVKSEMAPIIESIGRIRQAARGGAVLREVTTTTTRTDGTTVTRTEREYSRPEWTADAWFAERKDPEAWGKRDRLIIERGRILDDARRYAMANDLDVDEVVAETERMLREGSTR